MTAKSIPEAVLQRWFDLSARNRGIGSAIRNKDALTQRLEVLARDRRSVESTTHDGLQRAKHVCQVLTETDLLCADNSIAPAGCSQMRPDLVLFTSSAHYVLVELKTRSAAERQGVQELLAYSTGIKMQAPYVNEFFYVIVAQAWDESLSYSVRALILDGKHVLPIRWAQREAEVFELDIMLELFEFDFAQPFDPWFAMTPCTMAVRRPIEPTTGRLRAQMYFAHLAHQLVAHCRQLNQTGFVLIWSNPVDYGTEMLNITLVTVNQHWLMSEHLPENYMPLTLEEPAGFLGAVYRQSQGQFKAIAGSAAQDDFWALSTAHEEAGQYYPQSTLSYDVIQGRRDSAIEMELQATWPNLGQFELSTSNNLSSFLQTLPAGAHVETGVPIRPFGELADLAGQVGQRLPPNLRTLDQLVQLLHLFRRHKVPDLARAR